MPRTKGLFEDFMRTKHWRCLSRTLIGAMQTIDLTKVNVFEFDWLINDAVFADRALCDEVQQNEVVPRVLAGDLRLPFPHTVITWKERHDGNAPPNSWGRVPEATGDEIWRLVVAMETTDEAFFDVIAFERDVTANSSWVMLPSVNRVLRDPPHPNGEVAVQIVVLDDIEQTLGKLYAEALPVFQESGSISAGNTALISALLARPGSVLDPFLTAESNKLRRLRGLKVLPPVIHRVVRFGDPKPRAPRNPDATPTGTVRAPHDRRSHNRKLASGKIVSVRASKVHGGRTGLVLYDVVEDAA